MTDSARIRQLEQERDAAIAERDEEREKRERDLRTSMRLMKERDAAVAACAAKDMMLRDARNELLIRVPGSTPMNVRRASLVARIEDALRDNVGARLLEERRLLRAGLKEIIDRQGVHCQGECSASHDMVEIASSTLAKVRLLDEETKR